MPTVIEGLARGCCRERLHTLTVLPSTGEAPAAILLFHHGLGDYCGRYLPVFKQLAEAGIAVYAADAAGHGRSEGTRALISHFKNLVDDFEAVAAAARADAAARTAGWPAEGAGEEPAPALPPFFVAGHSLGGLIAATLAARNQALWAGLLVLSPALDMEWSLGLRIQAAIGRVLSHLVPRARVVDAVHLEDLSPDPARVEAFRTDPLGTTGRLPARTAHKCLAAMRNLRRRWHEFTLPIYGLHGDADRCTSAGATRAFVEAASSADKVVVLVPGGYHELLMEPGGEALVHGLAAWILERSGGAKGAAKGASKGAGAGKGLI